MNSDVNNSKIFLNLGPKNSKNMVQDEIILSAYQQIAYGFKL